MIKKNALKDDSTRQALIAKLMATENIDVRFERVPTAAFDLKNRQLVLPIYEHLTDDVYSMMIAHEVSHALHTPNDGWENAITTDGLPVREDHSNFDKKKMSYLNIIEDARIEKLIKKRYPGVVNDFKVGYKELHNRDFFGLKKNGVKVSELSLIDRLNLYFKSYGHLSVPFSEDERVWVERVSAAMTFDDVLNVVNDLYDSFTEPPMPNAESADDAEDSDSEDSEEGEGSSAESTEDGDEDGASSSSGSDGDDANDSEGEGSDSDDDSDATDSASGSSNGESGEGSREGSADTESGNESDSKESGSNDNDSEGVNDDDSDNDSDSDSAASSETGGMGSTPAEAPAPITQDNFDDSLKENAAKDDRYYNNRLGTGYVVDRVFDEHWADFIDPVESFISMMRENMGMFNRSYEGYSYGYRREIKNPYTDADILSYYKVLNKRNGKVINHMIKEFELKKSAAEHRRTLTSKTGMVDMDRLYNYKITDDIFLSHEITPDGKNHGVVILIDFSGSMAGGAGFGGNRIQNTMNQVFNFAAFCSKVGIPYRVFGFTNTDSFESEDRANVRHELATRNEVTGRDGMTYHYRDSFRLIEIVNSTMRKNDWLLAMGFIAGATGTVTSSDVDGKNVYDFVVNGWLCGTPLNAALYIMPWVIRDFIKKNRIDRAVFMLFTDGNAGDTFVANVEGHKDAYGNMITKRFDLGYADSLFDPRTKDFLRRINFKHFNDMLQTFLTRRIKLMTGAKVMGYDIRENGKRGAYGINNDVREILDVENSWTQDAERATFYKENGFFHLTDLYDFDSFTFISEANKVEDASIESEIRGGDVENASRKAIENAFIRANRKTNDSRFLVKKLMEVIG
jgi:hypothetical protein